MEGAGDTSVDYLSILHPELMSREELLKILIEKKVIKDDDSKPVKKHNLVELFYKSVVPMAQRKYRMNRRGKMMTKRQIQMAKRKRTHQEANTPTTSHSNEVLSIYSRNKEANSRLGSFGSPTSTSSVDRLKPPPSGTTGERKIIRLSSSSGPKQAQSSSSTLNSPKMAGSSTTTTVTSNTSFTKSVPLKEKQTVQSKPIKIKRHVAGTQSSAGDSQKATNSATSSSTDVINHGTNTCAKKITDEASQKIDEGPVIKKFKAISVTWP